HGSEGRSARGTWWQDAADFRGAQPAGGRPAVDPSRSAREPVGALFDDRGVPSWRDQSAARDVVYAGRNLDQTGSRGRGLCHGSTRSGGGTRIPGSGDGWRLRYLAQGGARQTRGVRTSVAG